MIVSEEKLYQAISSLQEMKNEFNSRMDKLESRIEVNNRNFVK